LRLLTKLRKSVAHSAKSVSIAAMAVNVRRAMDHDVPTLRRTRRGSRSTCSRQRSERVSGVSRKPKKSLLRSRGAGRAARLRTMVKVRSLQPPRSGELPEQKERLTRKGEPFVYSAS
jgi:hypothetical protein